MFRILFVLLALCVQGLLALDTVVDLGYAKYRGLKKNGVIRWAGMRYARSVSRVDGMRFAAPQDPLPERPGSIVDAIEFGSICIGAHAKLPNEFGGKQSEDCLFANVFAPANANSTSKLPVYVFIQGGGFNDNGNANYNGSELIEAANGELVVVNFNYRVGPYGFLASKEIVDDKSLSLNNGLKDQRQLLKWVQTYITKFGGDPNHVTLGGASAGAGSVVFQLTAYGGRDDKLFHAAVSESPAFPPIRSATNSQFAYDALRKQTGCPGLKCMREMDAVTFQTAVRNLKVAFPMGNTPPIYFWNPTLDYDIVRDYTYNELKAGHLVRVPTIFGDTTNEGWVFTPQSITSQQRAEEFLANQFTSLNKQEKSRIRQVWRGPANQEFDNRWKNIASDIYGHIRYNCGGLNISAAYSSMKDPAAPTWQYRWNVGPANHVGELGAIWNNGTTAASVFIHGFFVSFVRTYDPNSYSTTFQLPENETLTSPEWKQFGDWDPYGNGVRMRFNDDNDVAMEEVSKEERTKCDVLTSMGVQLEQAVSAANRSEWTSWLGYFTAAVSMAQWLWG